MDYRIDELIIGDKRKKSDAVIVLKYTSIIPYSDRKEQNHTEIFKAGHIARFTLNQSSITLHFRSTKLKLSVLQKWDLEPLIQLVDLVTGSGLQVVEHFSNFRNTDNFKE